MQLDKIGPNYFIISFVSDFDYDRFMLTRIRGAGLQVFELA